MKKVLSIALCMVMLITTISAIPTSAKIIFTSHNSFYEETDNTDTHYYKIIDGVYYVIIDQCCDNYGYVAAILPPKETKKVEILDEISFGGETVEISAIDIEKQYRFSNMNSSLEELVIGNIQYVKGIN